MPAACLTCPQVLSPACPLPCAECTLTVLPAVSICLPALPHTSLQATMPPQLKSSPACLPCRLPAESIHLEVFRHQKRGPFSAFFKPSTMPTTSTTTTYQTTPSLAADAAAAG
ncbi:hypothetical protein GGX14DRAFT_404783 [Mycena pura]|uniref:Uncharacterized protein n=1 Tax=Mycena pura TaxID=153505 RepID=A0AAD6Y4Y7_9AGAR|nr:hypothetical protein GGX14DRAFT_404783 [Mycena pura]